MRSELSCRERLLTAIDRREPDHIPLWNRGGIPLRYFKKQPGDIPWPSQSERLRASLGLGVDDVVYLEPPRPLRHEVDVRVRSEHPPTERHPLLVKEYRTPKGTLTKAVRQTLDWPHGADIPLLDDYSVSPGRSVKDWIENPEDLEAFSYVFREPTKGEVDHFMEQAERARSLAERFEVPLVATEVTYLGTAAMLLCGFVNVVLATVRRPEFLSGLLDVLHERNIETIELLADAGIDIIVHNGWYDSADFWSPKSYRAFILPRFKQEVNLAHRHKIRFGYSMASGVMPLIEAIKESGVDLLYGIDPIQGGFDMKRVKDETDGKICLWGGVNAHVTLELGSAGDVRNAVRNAISTLGPNGGFILSSVGAIYPEVPIEGIEAMIRAWQEFADYPLTV